MSVSLPAENRKIFNIIYKGLKLLYELW